MEVILTHENADFDAIASLLGAHKLFPEAVPVLPRRVNRNCRAFLSLYGAELPLVHPDDLPPRRRIRRAILVDTQGLTTLKGMVRGLPVDIIDHHEPNRDLPAGWRFSGEPMGATTTLLVEEISQRSLHLTRIEATLLLMGIYEDTGTLSYLTTTPRDVRAAAWLMEQGANLAVVNEFLHHPLTSGQRELYERLLDGAVTHEIGGHVIVVATGRADGYDEEISTLAHKLRELLEPSALFVLVALNDHVQLVARSTTNDIDVSAIAAHFGGGGHTRAAAAMVRNRTLESVHAELLNLLPRIVRPAVTVGQIMSRGVQILSPDTTVAEADDRMRRTGHEGYPVVENGQVVGLLTRRAVDRALQFGMVSHPVRQVMEPGNITVAPDDPVEKLQRLMIEAGWGQVPVVRDGEIIGVVTRTDLITLWGTPPGQPRQTHVQALLENALPPQTLALVQRTAETAQEMGYSLYFVGGLVRDLLLGAPIVDVDLVVEGEAIRLARHLAQLLGGRVVAHDRFGTAKWILNNRVWQGVAGGPPPPEKAISSVDFATARTEFYTHPTALPEVERSSIKQDLHRRDFTINTLAIRLDPPYWGQLLDFYGGEADLRDGIIRVLHSLSFVDDPTRILRAARLEARLGFSLDPRSEKQIANALPMLSRVSGDRIRHELEQILDEEEPERALCRLDGLGVLQEIHPDLRCDSWLSTRFQTIRGELDPATWEMAPSDRRFLHLALFLYRLESRSLEAVLKRLKVPRADADDLRMLPDLRRVLRRVALTRRPSRIYRLLRPYPARLLAAAWTASDRAGLRGKLLRFQTEYRRVETALTGEDLKRLGLRPGPLFGRLLSALRDARLDGQVATREEEEALLRRLLKAEGVELNRELRVEN
ncbi:MAG TPA: CBS domain-containing protein [Anaerolineales bacterium]|nr:CBS domain-containing protein [Anaerolineales bacterium]